MPHNKREWNPRFHAYMEMIVNHPNYNGLPIKEKKDGGLSWIAPAKSDVGQARVDWCVKKAYDLGLINRLQAYAGMFADVMLEIHPTKWKVCQTCGKSMSLYYHYPNNIFLASINKEFNSDFTDCDHISDIWDELVEHGVDEFQFASFLISKGHLDLEPYYLNPTTASKDEIIGALEYKCRKGNMKLLGPGAMSNFPDRYDGFHTYNRCCRSSQDTGRSKENLKSYTRDRRAYEYWSDGNIHAANQFMGSQYFVGTSADHIGPISLGFVHDPRYLQPMLGGDNSAKRDRLQYEDIEKIIEIHNRTGVYPMSWYSRLIWEHIRANYNRYPGFVPTIFRDALKQNMTDFMFILWWILQTCPLQGEAFLTEGLLSSNYNCFNYSYEFNANGEIIAQNPRHFTGRNINEVDRYKRIAIQAVFEFNEKNNRHCYPDLTPDERQQLNQLCDTIKMNAAIHICLPGLISLVENIERRIIASLPY